MIVLMLQMRQHLLLFKDLFANRALLARTQSLLVSRDSSLGLLADLAGLGDKTGCRAPIVLACTRLAKITEVIAISIGAVGKRCFADVTLVILVQITADRELLPADVTQMVGVLIGTG